MAKEKVVYLNSADYVSCLKCGCLISKSFAKSVMVDNYYDYYCKICAPLWSKKITYAFDSHLGRFVSLDKPKFFINKDIEVDEYGNRI